jgi:hypothetical protein
MSLQLHRPDGKGGLEVRTPAAAEDHRSTLRSPRWGAALEDGELPELRNVEMNPTSTARSVAFWLVLGLLTFAIITIGYLGPFWTFPQG